MENDDNVQFLGTQQVSSPSKQVLSQTQVLAVEDPACSLSESSTSSLLDLDDPEVCAELCQKPVPLYSLSQNISIDHLPSTFFTTTRRAQGIKKKNQELNWHGNHNKLLSLQLKELGPKPRKKQMGENRRRLISQEKKMSRS